MNKDQQNAKINALKTLYQKEESLKDIESCTFRPQTNNSYYNHKFVSQTPRGYTNVIERNAQWQKHREMKINHLKNQREQEEAGNCTFKPNISHNEKAGYASGVDTSTLNCKAIEKYLHRQQLARMKKEETQLYEEYLKHGGSACQNSYSWKSHKDRYIKERQEKSKSRSKPRATQRPKQRVFSFSEQP